MKKHWIVLFILVVILGTLAYLSTWTVDKVQVEGCEIVNTQSVSDAMKEEAPLDNTLLLYPLRFRSGRSALISRYSADSDCLRQSK